MAFRDRLLGTKTGYSTFRRVVRADRAMRMIVDQYLCPQPGETILDLGCGTGSLAAMLPELTSYIGVDNNPAYLTPTDLPKEGGST
ncbi:MAG: hypothetical protein WCJ42_12590, partial [Actinomycetes bacterium]